MLGRVIGRKDSGAAQIPRVSAGDPITASGYNKLVDSANRSDRTGSYSSTFNGSIIPGDDVRLVWCRIIGVASISGAPVSGDYHVQGDIKYLLAPRCRPDLDYTGLYWSGVQLRGRACDNDLAEIKYAPIGSWVWVLYWTENGDPDEPIVMMLGQETIATHLCVTA